MARLAAGLKFGEDETGKTTGNSYFRRQIGTFFYFYIVFQGLKRATPLERDLESLKYRIHLHGIRPGWHKEPGVEGALDSVLPHMVKGKRRRHKIFGIRGPWTQWWE